MSQRWLQVVYCEPGAAEVRVPVDGHEAHVAFDSESRYHAFAEGTPPPAGPVGQLSVEVEQKGPGGAVSALTVRRAGEHSLRRSVILVWQAAAAAGPGVLAGAEANVLWERFWAAYGPVLGGEAALRVGPRALEEPAIRARSPSLPRK